MAECLQAFKETSLPTRSETHLTSFLCPLRHPFDEDPMAAEWLLWFRGTGVFDSENLIIPSSA
jgi:hypothetical protein